MRKTIYLRCIPLAIVLTACHSSPTTPQGVTIYQTLWRQPIESVARSYLFGNTLIGWNRQNSHYFGYDLRKKKKIWELNEPSSSFGDYAAYDGQYIYLYSKITKDQTYAQLYILKPDGEIVNHFPMDHESDGDSTLQGGPYLRNSFLYVISDNELLKYSTADLIKGLDKPLWTFKQADSKRLISMYLDVTTQDIYVSGPTSKLYALDDNGKVKWTADTHFKWDDLQTYFEAFAIKSDQNGVYAVTDRGAFQGFDKATGEKLWGGNWASYDTCPSGASSLADYMSLSDGVAVVGPLAGGCIQAFNLKTGQQAWQFMAPDKYTFDSVPLILGNTVYATNSSVWALDLKTGKLLGHTEQNINGNNGNGPMYDAVTGQLLTWGEELQAYKIP